MEKISGIVPSTARVQSVNLKDGPTMRPGAPSFGAPTGKAALNGGSAPTTAEKAVAAHNKLMARRSGDSHKPAIIKEMADRFFLKNKSEAGGEVQDIDLNFQMDLDSQVYRHQTNQGVQGTRPEVSQSLSAEPQYQTESSLDSSEWVDSNAASGDDSGEYMPPGSYLDVSI